MALTNEQLLTRGGRKYAAKKSARSVEEVKFDNDSRKEFLTGFHKRKVARQAEAKRKAEELNRQQRLLERRKIKEERRKEIDEGMEKLREAEAIIEGKTLASDNGDQDNGSSEYDEEEEFKGFSESSGILKRRKVNFGDVNVTVEAMEPSLDPYVDIKRSEDVLAEATRKANEYADYVASLEAPRPKPAPKKKFRYLPKTERKKMNKKRRSK